ncbi:MAG: hypothetical protein HQK78_08785 [Desulfobacterales bacterium]|nr:hypothetical protein [Desulfobacterales bacterium]
MNNTLKGLLILGGALAGGILACTANPVLAVVTATETVGGFLGIGGTTAATTTYTVSGIAAAGTGACAAIGAGVGKIAGQTGGTLVIQGLDEVSQNLINKLKSEEKPI